MEIMVVEKRENALLERTEVRFRIAHPESGTPTRAEIRKALAGALNVKNEVVILDWARSEFGRSTTQGYAKVYKGKDRALALETSPILIRNGLLAAVKKAEAPPEAAPEAPPRKEPPKEAPKAEEKKEEKKETPKPEKKEAPKPAKEEKAAKKEPAKKEEAPKKPAAKKEGK